ncbi:hypothetical protein B0H11DRAFT_2238419 [Mycena galericulata]|nr:hypothetical protein B0H11DRAFT_2258214 [Mycena galericulata]KAJ7469359.1 hypothetical protein B0H11DRAFT_2238419 [Mycena galericulata]
MTDQSVPAAATNASNAEKDLEALLATVAGLAQMSLAMTKHCVDLQTRLPTVFNAAVKANVATIVPAAPTWVELVPRTPAQLEAAHPPGSGDDIAYHVVLSGREPGLYSSVAESDSQVLGVPNSKRLRKGSRLEALAYYRAKYNDQDVHKWAPEAEVLATTAANAAALSAAGRR